jgi:transcriptional regulator GlxA family with amidase domain
MRGVLGALVVGGLGLVGGCRATVEGAGGPGAVEGRLRVGFLIVDGVYNSELVAPYDVFQHTVFHTEPGMEVFTVAPSASTVRSFEGLEIVPHYTYRTAPPIDVLVVPSAEHSMDSDLEDERLMSWVRRVGSEADYVLSLCDGAFVLAAAGLLDGLESTTFPGDIEAYRERFPRLVVHQDVSFVHDGRAITSAGGAKSYDPALYLCELLYGAEVARGIGAGLVIDWDASRIEHVVVKSR